MKSNNPVETLAASVYSACLQDLAPIEYPEYEFGHDKATNRPTKKPTGRMKQNRPDPYHVTVTMFEQVWSSTALGFGGVGGQAITSAYTVVVEGPCADFCVYFGGRLAYRIERPNQRFMNDLRDQRMATVADAKAFYENDRRDDNQGGV